MTRITRLSLCALALLVLGMVRRPLLNAPNDVAFFAGLLMPVVAGLLIAYGVIVLIGPSTRTTTKRTES